MIFRITQKLAKKIKVVPSTSLTPPNNPLLDWTANLFMVSRWQFIILTNTYSLYSVILPGRGISDIKSFVIKAQKYLHEYMLIDNTAYLFDMHFTTDIDSISFGKTGDRRIIGSMNDLIHNARDYLLETSLPIPLVNMRLNEMPMSVLEFSNPKEVLLSLSNKPIS